MNSAIKSQAPAVSAQKSAAMSKVRAKDTKPERVVRSLIHAMGYRFRLHRRDLPGTPDIVLPKYRKIVLVHGCFWHRHPDCPTASLPKTRAEFWRQKLDGNVERDKRTLELLMDAGWKVLVVWECETRDTNVLAERLSDFIEGGPKRQQ